MQQKQRIQRALNSDLNVQHVNYQEKLLFFMLCVTADVILCHVQGIIEFLLNTTAACYVTFYWDVRKDAIDSVLCKQQNSTFDDSENSDNDSDLEESPSIAAVPLEHFLQGAYKERSASELYP